MLKNTGFHFKKVYLSCGYTDLRNGIDGLAYLVQEQFQLSPFDEGTLFLFCGRKPDRIKGLLWEEDGFLLLYKRLESGRYRWPRTAQEVKELSAEQYDLLINGLSIESTIHKVDPKVIR